MLKLSRTSRDIIWVNCLFSAAAWEDWETKKDKMRLFHLPPTRLKASTWMIYRYPSSSIATLECSLIKSDCFKVFLSSLAGLLCKGWTDREFSGYIKSTTATESPWIKSCRFKSISTDWPIFGGKWQIPVHVFYPKEIYWDSFLFYCVKID